MRAGSLFNAHRQRRSKAHLFHRPAESAPIESVTRNVVTRDIQVFMKGDTPCVRMAKAPRAVALSLPRVRWMERP